MKKNDAENHNVHQTMFQRREFISVSRRHKNDNQETQKNRRADLEKDERILRK